MKLTYDDVVSICDAHGICLPVDCVEMVVSIVEHIHPDHSGDAGEKIADTLAELGNSEHPCTEAAAVPQDGGEKAAAHVTLPAPDTTHYAQWAGDTIKHHSDDQIYEFANARVKAALASNKAALYEERAHTFMEVGTTERGSAINAAMQSADQAGFTRGTFKWCSIFADALARHAHLASNKAAAVTATYPTPISISTDQIAEIAGKYNLGNPRLDALRGFVNEVIIVNGAKYAKSE